MATLVAEAVQGQVQRTLNVPAGQPKTMLIDMASTVFPTDATLSFKMTIEESFDGGASFKMASGFPSTSVGGSAGTPTHGGGVSSGLPEVGYAFDGTARILRATATPYVNGAPGQVVTDPNDPLCGLLAGSVPGSFDWGLTAAQV